MKTKRKITIKTIIKTIILSVIVIFILGGCAPSPEPYKNTCRRCGIKGNFEGIYDFWEMCEECYHRSPDGEETEEEPEEEPEHEDISGIEEYQVLSSVEACKEYQAEILGQFESLLQKHNMTIEKSPNNKFMRTTDAGYEVLEKEYETKAQAYSTYFKNTNMLKSEDTENTIKSVIKVKYEFYHGDDIMENKFVELIYELCKESFPEVNGTYEEFLNSMNTEFKDNIYNTIYEINDLNSYSSLVKWENSLEFTKEIIKTVESDIIPQIENLEYDKLENFRNDYNQWATDIEGIMSKSSEVYDGNKIAAMRGQHVESVFRRELYNKTLSYGNNHDYDSYGGGYADIDFDHKIGLSLEMGYSNSDYDGSNIPDEEIFKECYNYFNDKYNLGASYEELKTSWENDIFMSKLEDNPLTYDSSYGDYHNVSANVDDGGYKIHISFTIPTTVEGREMME
jgi:hypothetical protein